MSCDERFTIEAAALGHSFDGEIKIGGNYVPLIRDGKYIHISGQIPRVGDIVQVTGAAGSVTTLADARIAASICVMRALALLRHATGTLESVNGILRMTVYVQSDASFTQQSEVADAASDILTRVLGQAGVHTRSSVGVVQLPKNATVELDLVAMVD